MKLKFTELANTQLRDIYEYCRKEGYGKYGRTIQANILKRALQLREMPKLGKVYYLPDNLIEYRFLVVGDYKFYYKIETETDRIIVVYIFDTRQAPGKFPSDFSE